MATDVARFFDAMADGYEVLEPWYEHLYARLHARLREALVPRGAARALALDAGCGTGLQAEVLAGLGYRVHGVDLSPGLLARARRRCPGAGLAVGDLVALPLGDARFDAAVCCGSTLSFVERPAEALAELARVLRPGGRLLLDCEHRWSLDAGWALLSSLAGDPLGFGLSPREAWRVIGRRAGEGCWVRYPGYPPLRLFTGRELDGLLRGVGLGVRQVWGLHTVTNLLPSTWLHRPRLGRLAAGLYRALRAMDARVEHTALARGLGNSLVVLAEKPPGPGPAPASIAPARGAGAAGTPEERTRA